LGMTSLSYFLKSYQLDFHLWWLQYKPSVLEASHFLLFILVLDDPRVLVG